MLAPRAVRSLAALASFAIALTHAAIGAASIVVAKLGGDVHVAEARFAYASTPERTVVWEQVQLDATRGELAWIVAVPRGGWIEAAEAGWLDALEGASAPTIGVDPALGCGTPAPSEDTAQPLLPDPPRAVDRAMLGPMPPLAALDALRAEGWTLDPTERAELADLDAAGEDVEVLHLPAGSIGATRAIRVLGAPGRRFPITLLPAASPALRLVAWTLAPSRTQLAGLPAIEPEWDRLAWLGSKSSYDRVLLQALSAAGQGVAVPFASPDALFVDTARGPLTRGASVTRRYFGADDASSGSPWTCARRVSELAAAGGVVAPTCPVPPPWTTTAPLPACASAASSAIAAARYTCLGLDDLAVAVGGSDPSATWLTRWEATIAVQSSTGADVVDAKAPPIPGFHLARSASAGACTTGAPPDGVGTGSAPNGAPPTEEPGGADQPPLPPSGGGCDASFGCARTGATSPSSSDGCGSSTGSSHDDGCGKSSSSGGDSCGKSSSSSDDGCGKSSSGAGDGCGKAGSSSDNGCALPRGRAPLRASPFGYLAIALAVVARRLGRRPLASRPSRRAPTAPPAA